MHASGVREPYQSVAPEQSALDAPATPIIECCAAEMLHAESAPEKLVQPLAAAHLQLPSAAWMEYACPPFAHDVRHDSTD